MSGPLEGKVVVLGVTGSIACYKALDLASKLVQAGARAEVILTRGAMQFVTPLAFRSITHRPVVTEMFDPYAEMAVEHVALARLADILVVAPATAHFLAKAAQGLADDPLTTTLLATEAPVLLAPAMDAGMYQNSAVQENLERLRQRGYTIAGPAHGRLASGLVGMGRLLEPEEILGHIRLVLGHKGDLTGKRVVVSAGGTQEPIDPVRMVTNRSSGKMGYALAEAARDRGAQVTLVSAPTALPCPIGVRRIPAATAQEMAQAVLAACQGAHVLIMAAAVADYRPVEVSPRKVKKGPPRWMLELEQTQDILSLVPPTLVRVGFAAESEELEQNARKKLEAKGLDLVVANDITDPESGFGVDTNRVLILDREGAAQQLPLLSKYEVAHRVLDRVARLLGARAR